jgi:hypothetical protein
LTVDVLGVLLFALLVYLGWRSGAIRQVFRILGLIAVVVGVPFLSPVIREIVFDQAGRSTPGVEVISMIGAGIVIYVSVVAVGWISVGVMRTVSSVLSLLDRAGGAAIGALKAAILLYLLAVLVLFLEGPIDEADPENQFYLRGGQLTETVADYNILATWQFPDLKRIQDALIVGRMADETGAYELLREEGDAADFLRDQRVRELLDDETMMTWVDEEHYPMLLADGRVREVLNDPSMLERLNTVDWTELRRQMEEEDEEAETAGHEESD